MFRGLRLRLTASSFLSVRSLTMCLVSLCGVISCGAIVVAAMLEVELVFARFFGSLGIVSRAQGLTLQAGITKD
jgi:hypothetical protein